MVKDLKSVAVANNLMSQTAENMVKKHSSMAAAAKGESHSA